MHYTKYLPTLGAIVLTLCTIGLVAGCGGDDDDDDVLDEAEDESADADDDGTPIGDEEVQADDDDEGAGDDGDDDDGVDACSLLTTDEAESLLEEPVTDPQGDDQTTPLFSVCSWAAEAETSFAIIVLQVLTDEFPGGAEAFYDATIEGLGEEEYEEISGLGDEAVYYAGLLQAREGDELIALSVALQDGDEATNKEKTEEAAAIVLDRLD